MPTLQRANNFRLPIKSILLLLFWNFAIKFVYNLFFLNQWLLLFKDIITIEIEVFVAIIFLCLAPVASFVADVKFGRFRTLVSSTYIVIISNSIYTVGMCGGFFFAVHKFNYLYYIFATLIIAGLSASFCGMVFFLCNII